MQNYHWPLLDDVDDDLYLHPELGRSLRMTSPLRHEEMVVSPRSDIRRWDPLIDEPEFQRDINLPLDGM